MIVVFFFEGLNTLILLHVRNFFTKGVNMSNLHRIGFSTCIMSAMFFLCGLSGVVQAYKYDLQLLSTSDSTYNPAAYDINAKGYSVGVLQAFPFSSGYFADNTQISTKIGLGGSSLAYGLNNANQVVGWSTIDGVSHAFYYDGINTVDFKLTLEQQGILSSDSRAYRANDGGKVVGMYWDTTRTNMRTFLYDTSTGSIRDIGDLGGSTCMTVDMNNSGQIVGNSYLSDNITSHAFLYKNNVMLDLGTLGGSWSVATGINQKSQIVGYSLTSSGAAKAFIYENGTMKGIINPPYTQSSAYAVNANGQVIGFQYEEDGDHTFIYNDSDGDIIDLGQRNGELYGINDRGQIISGSGLYSGGQWKLYSDLVASNPGLGFMDPRYETDYSFVRRNLNNSGQITGNCFLDGIVYAYLMTPGPWTANGGGDWNTISNWGVDEFPQAAGDGSYFANSIGNSNAIINLNGQRTLSCLTFNNTVGGSYIISSGNLVLANTDESHCMIIVLAGNHSITANVELQNNLTVDTSNYTEMKIMGSIYESYGAKDLEKIGLGNLKMGGINSYTGKTLISEGTLELIETGQISTESEIITESTSTFLINGGIHTVGNISGTGTTEVISGDLTANSIVQAQLIIGEGATVTIAAIPGGPISLNDKLKSVPEPSSTELFAIFGLIIFSWQFIIARDSKFKIMNYKILSYAHN